MTVTKRLTLNSGSFKHFFFFFFGGQPIVQSGPSMKTRHLKVKRALVHHGLTARCHLCGHLLEIDFVYLEFRLEDSRCENSASQQVLK